MFNIPMNTKPALDLSAFGNGGAQPMNNGQNMNNNFNQPMQQPQQQYDNSYNQQQQMNNNNYNMNQQMNNVNYNQPMMQSANNNQMNGQPMQQAPMQPTPRPNGGGVILKKGQKTSLTKMNPNLSEVDVCLGWDVLNQACDLDASAFMLGANGKVIGDDWFVFYGQPASPDGSIVHHGDSRDGAGAGDDEVISIKLNQVNTNIQKITFVVTINEALERNLNFSMVANAYVRVVDKSSGKELVKFNLSDYYNTVTSMVVGELYRKDNEWRLNPVGDGVAKDLAGLCEMYGVNVAG